MEKIKLLAALVAKILLILLLATILFASVRGLPGNPSEKDLLSLTWRGDGPFELSPERGRFALLYSLVENKSFYFSTDLARFTIPDLGYKNGNYVSLFAPAVSYATMPGYFLGKSLGSSQVGTFSVIALFAFLNLLLIRSISKSLGSNDLAGWLSGIIFVFASPAFAYAVNLYQHHISTFLILLATHLIINSQKTWSLFVVWFLCAMSIPVDYPNLFLMAPLGLYTTLRMFSVKQEKYKLTLNISPTKILTITGVILPLLFFTWFNTKSYGDPFQFSGTVGSATNIDAAGKPTISKDVDPQKVQEYLNPDMQSKSAVGFFESRDITNGVYLHFISSDRGIITFTPIMVLGFLGIYYLYKSKNKYLAMLLGIMGMNILLYSLWGDPWGGWAFGSRYLIPSYAILSIFLSIALSKLNRKWWFITSFWLVLIYSIGINTLGAITTSANPPKIESLALEKISGHQERYSHDRNWEFLNMQGTKSFAYNTWFYKYITPLEYYYIIAGSIAVVATILTLTIVLNKNEEAKH